MMTKKRRVITVISGLVVIALVIVSGVLIAGQFARHRLAKQFPPPGKMIVSGDHRLHVVCDGDGPDTVILEAGLNDFSVFWHKVQSRLSKQTKTCTYDRAGLGWSELNDKPTTLKNAINDLHNVIATVTPNKPLILVGHSYGGILIRAYAQKYPARIKGMVLLDPASEYMADRITGYRDVLTKVSRQFKTLATLSSIGLMALAPSKIPAGELKGKSLQQYRALLGFGEFFHGAEKETAEMYNNLQTMKQISQTETTKWPVVIISRGKPEPIPGLPESSSNSLEKIWAGLQTDLANKLNARHIIAKQSRHHIQLSEPDLVIDTVMPMVSR